MPKSCSLPFQTLLDWHEGRLAFDANADADVRKHLQTGCANCQTTLQWLADTLPVLPEAVAPAPSPSPAALAYANGLARLLVPANVEKNQNGLIATVRRQFAYLVENMGPQQGAFVGARGAALPAMQRAFETENYAVRLWDEPDTGDGRYLIGQIYERETPNTDALAFRSVTLLPPGDANEVEAEREGSEFHFANVVPGVYLIRCLLENDEILMPHVVVGQA